MTAYLQQINTSPGGQTGGQIGGALAGPLGSLVGAALGDLISPGGGSTGGQEQMLLQLWGTADQGVIRSRLCNAGVPNCSTVPLLLGPRAYGITNAQAFGAAGCSSLAAPGSCPNAAFPGAPQAFGVVNGGGPQGGESGGGMIVGQGVKFALKSIPALLAAAEFYLLASAFWPKSAPRAATPQAQAQRFVGSTYRVKQTCIGKGVSKQCFPTSLVNLFRDTRCSQLSARMNLHKRSNPPEERAGNQFLTDTFNKFQATLRKEMEEAGCFRAKRSAGFRRPASFCRTISRAACSTC